MLKEAEESIFVRPLPPTRAERLKVIKDGCDKVLIDLQSLVERYQSLGTQSKRTWDRMRWGNEDIAEIRARLTSNITILTAFISTSQASVETKLDRFIEEFRQGKSEGSVVSLQTVDSLSADDKVVWRTIRKELEQIGISVAAFDANRSFIFDWFIRAVESGAFEEQNRRDLAEESNHSGAQESESSDEESSEYAPEIEPNVPVHGPKTSDQIFTSTPTAPKERRPQVPRVAALLAGMSRPRRRLIKAVEMGNVSKALELLKGKASFHLLDSDTLDKALWSATCQVHGSDVRPLISELIDRGGNVNYVSDDSRERTPLWNSVANGSISVVRLLVENGVDVNYKGSDRMHDDDLRGGAHDFAPRATLSSGMAILHFLLSSGVDVKSQYGIYNLTFANFMHFRKISLLQEAASLGAIPAMEILLDFGAEIDAVSPEYGTALMVSLWQGHENAAKFLLAKGADPKFTRTSSSGYNSPIEAAIIGGNTSSMERLLKYGAVPDDSTIRFAESVRHLFQGWDEIKFENIMSMLESWLEYGNRR